MDIEKVKAELLNLYETMQIREQSKSFVKKQAEKILENFDRYHSVACETGVPWFVIGIIHSLECGLAFDRHFFNGDPLTGKTVRYPPGYPKEPPANGKVYTWEESAIASIKKEGMDQVEEWTLGEILFQLEKYNGFGYRTDKAGHIPTPYLWSFTNHYTKGKWKEVKGKDGKFHSVFDPNLVSAQVGAATLIFELEKIAELWETSE